jgi:hypothetical protein
VCTVRLRDSATGAFSMDGSHLQINGNPLRCHCHAGNICPRSTHLSELVIRDECISRRNMILLSLPHDHQIDVEEWVKQETKAEVFRSRVGEIGHNVCTGERT